MNAVQLRIDGVEGHGLPVNAVALAREPGDIFAVRRILRGLDLDDEQVAVAEAAVELVRLGRYPATIGGAA